MVDDTNLLLRAKKLGTIKSVINHELKLSRNNKQSLNETKTELIIFRSPRNHLLREPGIRANNHKLKLHSHIKYSGILIDEVLSWNKQIDDICTKLATANDILSKPRHFVPKNHFVHVYQYISLCFTLMSFMVVWFGPTQPT